MFSDKYFYPFLFILNVQVLIGQNPPKWFETQWDDAIKECKKQKSTILSSLNHPYITQAEAMAVVFPEMLRYSLWRDFFETQALELFYVELGSKNVDFSIGWFQMKPSFAEALEGEVISNDDLRIKHNELVNYQAFAKDTISIRKERLRRLKQIGWQLKYLNAFIDLVSIRYPLQNLPSVERVRLMAAAYNRGFFIPLKDLQGFNSQKTFPYGPKNENPFSYAEVAEFFFLNNAVYLFTTKKQYQYEKE